MALWPFRRKSSRKRPRSGAALSDAEGPLPRNLTAEGAITRVGSQKKQRTEPAKLKRPARAYSFSTERPETLNSDGDRSPLDRPRHVNYPQGDQMCEVQAAPAWERTPTLHHNQRIRPPTRRKSSKQKNDERSRAAEIKAMSAFVPKRADTDAWMVRKPTKNNSKRVKTSSELQGQLTSEVSFSIPNSVHGSMTSDSDFASFRVSAFSSLTPRPTLRFAQGSRATPSRGSVSAQKRSLSEKVTMVEEVHGNRQRIDDLVDTLDSSDLRELMEREDRRRERKKQRDQERAECQLSRRVEQHKIDESRARQLGTPPPENLERGVFGRELIGLGLDPASAVVTSSRQRDSGSFEIDDGGQEAQTLGGHPEPKSPTGKSYDTSSMPAEYTKEPSNMEKEVQPQGSMASLPPSLRFSGLLRSKKSRSKSTLASDRERVLSHQPERIDEEAASRHVSVNSDSHARFSLSSFLRWGGKSRRNSTGPSSFSNTSREEMQAAAMAAGTTQYPTQAQAEALAKLQGDDVASVREQSGVYLSRKPSASTRTKSRFREDLPEFPVSPPDSPMREPDTLTQSFTPTKQKRKSYYENDGSEAQYHTPLSEYNNSLRSGDGACGASPPAPRPHHMSLASIDSEASWLSGGGGINKRSSTRRSNAGRAQRIEKSPTIDSPTNSTQDDLSIAGDEYLSRLSQHRNSGLFQNRLSGDGRPSSDEEDYLDESSAKWGAVGARPFVIQQRNTMHSVQGLLNIESGDEEEEESGEASPTTQENAEIHRTTSLNLKQNRVRNFSGGSAKLLDIARQSSGENKARTTETAPL